MRILLKTIKTNDFILYAVTLLGAFFLKAFFSTASTDQLKFILYPTSLVVEAISGNSFSLKPASGYAMEGSVIVIDKSCSGLNFFMISFCMAAFLCISAFRKPTTKVRAWVLAIIVSFIITVYVNGLRISVAIFLLQRFPQMPFLSSETGHHIQGILFYFSFLLLYYLLLNHFLKKMPLEKTTIFNPLRDSFSFVLHKNIRKQRMVQ